MLKNLPQTYRKRNLFLLLVFTTQIPKLVQQAKCHPINGFKIIPNVLKRKALLLILFIFCLGTSYAQCPLNTYNVIGGGAYCLGGFGVTISLDNSDVGVDYHLIDGVSNDVTSLSGTGSQLDFNNITSQGTYTIEARDPNNVCASVTMNGNATVTVNALPTITTAGATSDICFSTSAQTAQLTYSATTNSPTLYSISWDAAAQADGFVDVINASLTASPINISVPANAAANTYTGTITVENGNGCVSTGTTFTVTVTALPVATFSYTGTPYCQDAANPSPSFSGGGVAGTFSSSAGLVFVSTSTGEADLAASTPGTYTVTNTIAASGGCGVVTATSPITITALPVATFSYTGTPYCQDAANPSPSFSGGGVAGTFSSTAGLVFVSTSTGEVDLAASTPGSYTVTNTITASGGCGVVTATSPITITDLPVATFSYTGTPYCQDAANPSPSFSGGGVAGTFSSTAGLVFVSTSTGEVDLAASTPGTYTITNTIPASGGCGVVTATSPITITAVPTATISYAGSPFCKSIGTAQSVTLTGTGVFTGGTYSASPAGLSIDAGTGAITPSNSTAGTYTVTYTIPASGGCAAVPVTTSVTITAVPTATISYAGTPFCKSITSAQAVTLTGTGAFTGGNYSASPAGLFINASGGAITPSSSAAGTYTVTYTIPASGGCAAVPVTTSVTITAVPVATFSYAGTPYCQNASNPSPTFSGGGVAGTFSSTAGLVFISTSTGQINLSASTPGTYTVTNTIAASGGCSAVAATSPITITTVPTATISYAGTPFCKSNTSAQAVTLTGTGAFTGGTYSTSPAGLSINAGSGAITPSSSTAGTYTVTYTKGAAGGCSSFATTTSVTISAAPTAANAGVDQTTCGVTTVTLNGNQPSVGTGMWTIVSNPDGLGTIADPSVRNATFSGTTGVRYVLGWTISNAPCTPSTDDMMVTFNPTPNAVATPASQTVCSGTAITTIALSGDVGLTTFTWTRNNTTSGIASSGSGDISGTLTNTTNAQATVVFTITPTANGCNGTPTTATVAVDPYLNGTLSPSVASGCSGSTSGTITLSGETGAILTWESSTDGGGTWTTLSNTTSTLTYTNLTQATLYRVLIQSGVCTSYSSYAVVSVVPQQAPSPVIATPQTICAGQTALLSAGTGYQSIGVDTSGNFNNGNPRGWKVDGDSTGSFLPANGDNTLNGPWRETNAHPFNGVFYKAVNGKFAIANGNTNANGFILETPVFSLVGQTTATLSFFQAYILKTAGTSVTVSISTNGGSTYTTLTQTTGVTSLGLNGTGDTATMQPGSIDLSNYIGLSNLRIKFTYIGSANSSWVLDGVSLPGTLPITYAWTDPSTIITDPTKDTVRVQPANTTTYTITTFVGGCPAGNATVTVTVNPIPDAVATLAEQTSCSSAAFTISLSGNVTGTSFDWTRDNTSNVTGVDPGGSTSGDINGTLTDTFSMMQDVTFTITPTANGCVGSPVTAVVHVTQCVILPVAIINFIAYQKGSGVQINWTALNEINVDHYEVERSTNAMSFTSLGNVKALNNAASINYSKIDPSPLNGKNFYRIKAIDKNGAITYTGIALVNISNGKSSVSIYPNPIQNRIFNVQCTNLPAGNYNLVLYNTLGQPVLSRKIEHPGGSATQNFTLPVNAAAGAYIVKLFNKTFDFTSRIVVE